MERHGKDAIVKDGLGTQAGFAPTSKRSWGLRYHPHVGSGYEFSYCTYSPGGRRLNARDIRRLDTFLRPMIILMQLSGGRKGNGVRRGDLEKKHIGYENGALGGLLAALNGFTCIDHVLLNSPPISALLQIFTQRILRCPLSLHSTRKMCGVWIMRTRRKRLWNIRPCSCFLFPHNWSDGCGTRDEIERAMRF